MTAAAAPPPAMLEAMAELNFKVTHAYGLTEVYGPAVVCSWREEAWDDLPIERSRPKSSRARACATRCRRILVVLDPETMQPVPQRRRNHRRNHVPRQYRDERISEKSNGDRRKRFEGGYFHSGDLAVCHADGYIEIKDRSKDIIISGGENISTIEIEKTLYRHPAILEAAVVGHAGPEKWGETPCAFVNLHPGADAGEQEIIDFCRATDGALQGAAQGRFRRAAENFDRQDPEIRTA